MEQLVGLLGAGVGAALGLRLVVSLAGWLTPHGPRATETVTARGVARRVAYTYTSHTGQIYYLHRRRLALRSGRVRQVLYFARDLRLDEAVSQIPPGYEIAENERTGMPYLKKP